MRESATYGDVSKIASRPLLLYLVNHPDLIREVLVTHHQKIGRGSRVFGVLEYLMGGGLAVSDGPYHLQQRRLMQPQFHHRRVAGYSDIATGHTARFVDKWEDGSRVEMNSEMVNITLPIITHTLFNLELPHLAQRIGHAFHVSNAYLYRRLSQPPRLRSLLHKLPMPDSRRFKKELQFLDDTVYGLIAERRRSREGGDDILQLLLDVRDDESDDLAGTGATMTDQQVRDEVVTLFFAGHDSTAGTLAWAWHLLAAHPEIQDRFHQELDQVLAGRTITVDDFDNLPFTDQILTETLRLYPPLWSLGRMVFEPVEVDGYHIPAGVTLMVSPLITQRDPRWFADPEVFNPERWTPEFRQELHRFAYFPFSAGPNLCIGEGVAWLEMKIILATLGQYWRMHPDPQHQVQLEPHITLRCKGGLPLYVHRRN